MNLGDLIARLEAADPQQVVKHGFNHPHSYRGDYMDLAFEPATDVSVADMLADARSALGATYEGWKGGDFTMGEHTWCWLSQEGDASGETISALLLDLMLAEPAPAAVSVPPPAALDLLSDVDAYLCALHVHVARHDQIGADGVCGGCLLRERIAAALPALAAVPVPPPTDRAVLRDRIRRAVCKAEGFGWDTDMLEPDEYGEVADAVLAVLPEPAPRADTLREAADRYEEILANADTAADPRYWTAVRDITLGLRAMAAEAKPDRCPHGCDTSVCPCLACDADAEERDEQQAQANLDQLAEELAAAIASCPGYEMNPNPCRCPCEGCKHHCGAHGASGVVVEAGGNQAEDETPCGPAPSQCDAEAGEPCANHEREQAHAEGEHAFCGPECSETEPTAEEIARANVLALHQIGEQLAGIESWMWEHLANVRDTAKTTHVVVRVEPTEAPE